MAEVESWRSVMLASGSGNGTGAAGQQTEGPRKDPVPNCDIHHGFFHTARFDAAAIPSLRALLVADRVDSRAFDRLWPFRVVIATRDGHSRVIGKVTGITLRRSTIPRP